MALTDPAHFNRIIRLTLYRSGYVPLVIDCPRKGRKPSIEITGNFYPNGNLPAFNVTVKNLYLTMKDQQYTRLLVEAGYDGNLVAFEGTILNLYQEEPGPEGRTVIQCQAGTTETWINATIQMTHEAGTPLVVLLNQLQKKLGSYGVRTGTQAQTLRLKTRFEYDGTVRGAIEKLKKLFASSGLNIFMRGSYLAAVCQPGEDYINHHVLQFMSAPPQENTGGSEGTYYTTVTAPWMPELACGDRLTIPSRIYIRNMKMVGSTDGKQDIQVQSIAFHFGTTGGVNSMTVQGFLVRQNKKSLVNNLFGG